MGWMKALVFGCDRTNFQHRKCLPDSQIRENTAAMSRQERGVWESTESTLEVVVSPVVCSTTGTSVRRLDLGLLD